MRTHLLIEDGFKNSVIWNFFSRDSINVRIPQLVEMVEVVLLDFEVAQIVK